MQRCPKCSILALFWEPLLYQNRSCTRNLDFSKNAFSPRREHSKSQIVGQLLMRMCFRIASETQCELTSLLVTIFAPNCQIWEASWGAFWVPFWHHFRYAFQWRFFLIFFCFLALFGAFLGPRGVLYPSGQKPIPPVFPPCN